MANFCSRCGKQLQEGTEFCINCGHSIRGKAPAQPDLHVKKEKVLGSGSGRKRRRKAVVIVCAAVAILAIYVYSILPVPGNKLLRAQPVVAPGARYPVTGQQMTDVPVKVAGGKISVPLDLVLARKFVAFSYEDSRTSVPLLAYVSGEGKIVTAVSMCEPCNSRRFHIQGGEIVCNSCGTKWKINTMEAISGSCGKYPPDVVPNTIAGNEIIIDEETVAQWQRRI